MRLSFQLGVGLVLCASLADLVVGLRGHDMSVPPDAMAAAAAALKSEQKTGDLIVHSPLFSVRELQALGEIQARPDLPSAMVRSSRRILLLDRSDYPMYGFDAPSRELDLPAPLVLRIYEPQSSARVPLYVLFSSLLPETMRVERPDGRVSAICNQSRPEGGFACPGEAEWLYAAQRTLRIAGQDRDCVWAHPTTGGVIVFNIPAQAAPAAGRRLLLELEAGMTDDAVMTTPTGATVRIEARQRGASIGGMTVLNQIGFPNAKLAIAPDEPVELRITTSNDGRRHHCLNAVVIEEEQK